MPNLDATAIAAWLVERGPEVAMLPATGPVDADHGARGLMLRLGWTLDETPPAEADRLAEKLLHPATAVNLRAALTQLGTARRLRLLDWLAGLSPSRSQALLALAMAPDAYGSFTRAELQALHQMALLARIFAPERRAALLAACQPEGMTGTQA